MIQLLASKVVPLSQSLRMRIARRFELILVLIALAVLGSGVWVYIVERVPGAAPFFSAVNLSGRLPSVFGALSGSLPTFAHAFSFSIFTALIMGPTRRAVLWACLSWLLIDTAFEIGQHNVVSSTLISSMPISETLRSYFVAGTFDLFDLLSIFLGVSLAYLILTTKPVRQ